VKVFEKCLNFWFGIQIFDIKDLSRHKSQLFSQVCNIVIGGGIAEWLAFSVVFTGL